MDSVNFVDIVQQNNIDTALLLPFVGYRFLPTINEGNVVLDVVLRGIGEAAESRHHLELHLFSLSQEYAVPPVQEHVITEWAACGVACVILPFYTGYRVLHVTQAGDGFDYWVGDDEHEHGLEVSGTINEDVNGRHRTKVKQFQNNPYGVDGFVSVTGFQALRSILPFHRLTAKSAEGQ